ncbi:MAG: hypothetical protein JWO38_1252 [Gemmataceae bacterium]|nr:hypothetical protein [Gemmataceae bacterium]
MSNSTQGATDRDQYKTDPALLTGWNPAGATITNADCAQCSGPVYYSETIGAYCPCCTRFTINPARGGRRRS